MFTISICVFQMDNNCILMKYYFHVYEHNSWHFMDINCILMKCDSKHENNNSCHFMDINCILMKYYFHVYDQYLCISNGH